MFTDILEFLKAYWRELFSCLVLTLSFVLWLFQKKPNKVIETIRQELDLILPTYIRLAEDKFGSGNGLNKRQFVIDLVKVWFNSKDYTFTDFYENYVCKMIEEILSTPSKK